MKKKTINKFEVVCVRESVEVYQPIIRSSKDISEFKKIIWPKGMPAQEEVWAIFLNMKNKVIGKSLIGRGSASECIVTPKELFRPAIMIGAVGLILVHNHTSGNPMPSEEDRMLTIRMYEAGRLLDVKVVDHVIFGEGKDYYYHSFSDEGIIG